MATADRSEQDPEASTVLPVEARDAVTEMETVLADLAGGKVGAEDAWAAIEEAARHAHRRAWLQAEMARTELRDDERVTTFQQLTAERVRAALEGSGWSQSRLADAMARLGFNWKRITVAEVVNGLRRVSLEELLGLAAVFGEPALWFLQPGVRDRMQLPHGVTLGPGEVLELLIGKQSGGAIAQLGEGGARWDTAADAAGVGSHRGTDRDWRPAREWELARDVALARLPGGA